MLLRRFAPTRLQACRWISTQLQALPLVSGVAAGRVLRADVGLSFWGGVCAETGTIVDEHHPLHGQCAAGKILAIPNGRGSCTGSQTLLELLLTGTAPSAILLRESDDIIALGVIVAEELFGHSIPIISLGHVGFAQVTCGAHACVHADGTVLLSSVEAAADTAQSIQLQRQEELDTSAAELDLSGLDLSAEDMAMLDGSRGAAAQAAMRILIRVARLQGATQLLDVTQAHIDSCIYVGEASLRFAARFVEWGGRVKVPTTLNAVSVDLREWSALGVDAPTGEAASALSQAYLDLGCTPSFTCAPYLLECAPARGEHIGWSESNAVLFANSCLGARTQKYADYLDVAIALTGRAPRAGCHLDEGRRPKLVLSVDTRGLNLSQLDDAFYGALGYLAGLEAVGDVPLLTGLESVPISRDQLKAFSAAFGTSGAAALFHINGHTPEARGSGGGDGSGGGGGGGGGGVGGGVEGGAGEGVGLAAEVAVAASVERRILAATSIHRAYKELGGGDGVGGGGDGAGGEEEEARASAANATQVQLVALGNPHFSLEETRRFAQLTDGLRKAPGVRVVLTVGREVREAAARAGCEAAIEAFGGTIVSDTCWCMLREPVVPTDTRTLVTNSAKYAHYAPGLVGKRVRFASLEGCVAAAVSGAVPRDERPRWIL